MPALTDAAAQARLLARRGADAAAVVLGASFHPFRTVRDGAHLVQGLMNRPEQVEPTPPATDLARAETAEKTTKKAAEPRTESAAKEPASKKTAAKKGAPKPGAAKPAKDTATKQAPGPEIVAKEPAPPVADPVVPADVEDMPVDPTGPAPHIPPRIAGEVERDYGDELPGIKEWGD